MKSLNPACTKSDKASISAKATMPSIDVATKMAKVLGVSLDWLVGNTDEELDAATLHRIQDINKLSQKDKELVFEFLDSFISNRKIKKALG